MPHCLVKSITGLSCPGCGLLRALHAALHGHFSEAIAYNYWLLLTLPLLLALALVPLLPHPAWRQRAMSIITQRSVIGFYIVTALAWFIVRNVYAL